MLISKAQAAKVIEACISDNFVCSGCMFSAGVDVHEEPAATSAGTGSIAIPYRSGGKRTLHEIERTIHRRSLPMTISLNRTDQASAFEQFQSAMHEQRKSERAKFVAIAKTRNGVEKFIASDPAPIAPGFQQSRNTVSLAG